MKLILCRCQILCSVSALTLLLDMWILFLFGRNIMASKRCRRPNFVEKEKEILIEALLNDKELARGILGGQYANNDDARKGWKKIADKINAVNKGIAIRSTEEIKAKFTDMKSRVKQKNARILMSRNKTGGGEKDCEDLTEMEQKILILVGKSAVHGIGGIDTEEIELLVEEMDSDCTQIYLEAEVETQHQEETLKELGQEESLKEPKKRKEKKETFEEAVLKEHQLINENLRDINEALKRVCLEIKNLAVILQVKNC